MASRRARRFFAEGIQFGDIGLLTQVVAKHRDVDVFGKPGDQTEGFGERGAAFEQQAGAAGCQPVEQRIQGPAHPKILFDILDCGTESGSSAEKQVTPLGVTGSDDGLEVWIQWVGSTYLAVRRSTVGRFTPR